MGGAMLKGWVKAGGNTLTATAASEATLDRIRLECPSVKTSRDNVAAIRGAEVIVLAVKPWKVAEVAAEIKEAVDFRHQIIISVAANISPSELCGFFSCPSARVFYAMPNIAAEYRQSMTLLTAGEGVEEADMAIAEQLLRQLGKVMRCNGQQLSAGNMLSGCGIAYIMRFLHAMTEGGVEMGLYPNDARAIALQAMKGAVSLLEESGMHPAVAIDKVTTPGGLTIRGLNELDHAGFNSAVIRCLKAGLIDK
ncbi:MAG: pyrroline-5-carboxylate reductase [Paludibacteraceae bacterium]|nr:pyrroline-5-carboxylate reductase [Paludibacteraceae bacterium]